MANWRALYKQISLSTEVNDMSEFAQLLFDRALIHSDDWGVVTGDPRQLKWLTMPGTHRPPEDFAAALAEMVEAGLIWWYWPDNCDKPLVQFICFDQYQPKTLVGNRTEPKDPIHHDHPDYADYPELAWEAVKGWNPLENNEQSKSKSISKSKSPKKKDLRLENEAVIGYREIARLHVPVALRNDWIACAEEVGAEKLLSFTKEWIGNGWNKQNVNGIMEYARKGGKGQRGAHRKRELTDQQRAFEEAAERQQQANA